MAVESPKKQTQFKPNQTQFKKGQNEYKLNYNKGLQEKNDFVVRINKANSNPISKRPKMNVNLYVIEDYENETALRPKKTNPIQTQFPSRNAKNALSTCLPKAPLPRHRQSYATWNLLLRPDRRPPHLQPGTKYRGNCGLGTVSHLSKRKNKINFCCGLA